MSRAQVLQRLEAAWSAFQASYAGLAEAQMLIAGVTGAWSVRDIVAHVTTWEAEALTHLPVVLRGERPPRYSVAYGGIDAFNALKTKEKAGLSLGAVRELQASVHSRLLAYLQGIGEENFRRETRFRRRLRLDTFGHYPKHEAAIRRWRAAQGV